MTIAQIAREMMTKEDRTTVIWGDGIMSDIGGAANVKASHPLDRIQAVANALARSKDFETFHVRANDSRGRPRVVRAFRLRPAA